MRISKRRTAVITAAVSATFALAGISPAVHAQSTGRRMMGIDVSDWQNQNGPTGDTPIDWTTVHMPTAQGGGGKDFSFIRSSRGGTTGTYDEHAGTGTLSHRYDDFAFVYNITQATANGMLAGPYHFGRPDILTNTGADEADHMIQQSGNWMRPGYMLPVFDFEAGAAERDTASLSQFSVDFANRIREIKGITPMVYINQSYAISEINSTVPSAMPNNWVARWPDQIYNDAVDHQNGNPIPAPVTQNVYGQWNTAFPQVATPEPWKFWQYGSRGRVPGIGAGAVAVDLDVAHGDMEYLKDFLVPALWLSDASGDWSTMSQWNSDNPGYIAGNDATGPAPRLPNSIDTVILDRGAANPTITLGSGNHAVRKLLVRENLNITGGSLTVGYVPYAPAGGNLGSGPVSAQFSSDVTLSGSGAFSVHTLAVDPARTLNLNGGSLTFDNINLATDSTTPAKILMGGDVNITGLNGRTATIASVGLLTPGTINLGGGTRTFTVADGAAENDLLVKVALQNGTLVKAGPGTMRLAGPVTSQLTVSGGTLVVQSANVPNVTNNATFVMDLASAGSTGTVFNGNGAFIKRGPGSLDVTPTQPFAGSVTVNDSTLRLIGGAARFNSASGFTINNGALTLDNSAASNSLRVGNAAPVTLNAGTFNFIGGPIATGEVAGPLIAASGASTVTLSGGNGNLTFANYTRAPGAALHFTGVAGSMAARFTGGVTPGAFIDQGTFVNGIDYAVTDPSGFVGQMIIGAGDEQYATTFTAGRHVRRNVATAGVAGMSIKTLNLFGAAGSTSLANGATLQLTNGGILHSGPTVSSLDGSAGANLAAPSDVEYVINTADPAGQLTINLPINGGSGLTKTGPGTLTLNGAGNYIGTTSVVGGKLTTTPASLGAGNIALSGGGALQITGLASTGRNVTLGPGGGSVSGGAWSGVFSGPGGLTLKDGSELILNGPGNTYSGPTIVNNGVLVAGQANLGDGSSTNTLALNNAFFLRTLGPISMGRGVSLGPAGGGVVHLNGYDSTFSGVVSGAGDLWVTGGGTLVLNSGGNTNSGAVTAAGVTIVAGPNDLGDGGAANFIRLRDGGRLRISDNLTSSRPVELNFGVGFFDTDGYAATVSGSLFGGGTFTKSGFGPLTLRGSNSSFSGAVAVNNGTLTLAGGGAASGTLINVNGYTINGGGVLKLDNSTSAGGNSNDRLSGSAPITMNGGTIWLYGGPTTEAAGNLTLASGYNTIILNGSTTTTLALGSYTRQAGATLNFLSASSTLKTTFTSGVTPGSFIDQGTFVGSNYAVYDAGGFVRAMATGAGDSDSVAAVTANRHVRLTATASGIATNSIYTLALVGNPVNATLAAGATLTLSKGGIISSGTTGNTISGGTAITTGAGTEFVIHTLDTGDLLTISTPLTGGSGLTKSGLGRVSLNAANTYAGPTTIAGGTLRLSTGGVIPDTSNLTIAANAQLDLATQTETVGGTLTIASGARVFSHTSNSIVSGGTLRLAGVNTTITYLAGGEGASIENATLTPGTAAGTTTFNIGDGDAAADLTISANIQDNGGARAITKLGAGTLRLAGSGNSFTGNVSISAGTLDVTGALTSGAGALDIPAAGTLTGTGTIAKPTTLSGGVINLGAGGLLSTLGVTNGIWKGAGSATGAVTVSSGTFTIGAGANLTANAGVNVTGGTLVAAHANSTINGSVTYASSTPGTWLGNITGAGKTLSVNALSNLTLTGANAYTGGTFVNAGQLNVTGNAQLGSGAVSTGSTGTLRLSGNVSYALPLSIGGAGVNGSLNAAPGSSGALDNTAGINAWSGPITLNGAGNNGGDALLNQIGSSAGTLILSGAIAGGTGNSWAKTGAGDIVLTGASPNTYTNLTRVFGGKLIIEKNQALGAAGSDINGTGHTFELIGSASTVAFRAPASSPTGFTYSTFEVINTEGTAAPGGFGQVDNLGGDNTFAGQIALAGPLNGGGAMLSSIGVTAGSLHVTGGIYARSAGTTPRDITKLGAGRLILSADSSIAPTNTLVVPLVNSTLNVTAGTVELRSPSATQTNLPGVTQWNVTTGGTAHLASGLLETATLNVTGGLVTVAPGAGKVIRANQLNVSAGGRIDLAESDMIINYPAGPSPIGTYAGSGYTGLTRLIADAYDFGAWDGPGSGITSSIAATTGGLTTIGIGEAAALLGISGSETTLWNGQVVDGTSVLAMYTYAGDANLDGVIDGGDYGIIDNFVQVPAASGYANGDFNYDGVVDGGDYGIIDNNIQAQGPNLSGGAAIAGGEVPNSVTAVPEPSIACAIAFIGATLTMRRRRRH